MSLRTKVLVELERAFPGQFAPGPSNERLIATFAGAHPLVGDVCIWDDGTEVMIAVGTITHLHIDDSDAPIREQPTPAEQAPEDAIASEVVAWLRDLFSDEILLWCSSRFPGTGGYQRFPEDAEWSILGPEDQTFRWSGPIQNPLA
jgi:hypothetical protein